LQRVAHGFEEFRDDKVQSFERRPLRIDGFSPALYRVIG
jgi:hypothetical protein